MRVEVSNLQDLLDLLDARRIEEVMGNAAYRINCIALSGTSQYGKREHWRPQNEARLRDSYPSEYAKHEWNFLHMRSKLSVMTGNALPGE